MVNYSTLSPPQPPRFFAGQRRRVTTSWISPSVSPKPVTPWVKVSHTLLSVHYYVVSKYTFHSKDILTSLPTACNSTPKISLYYLTYSVPVGRILVGEEGHSNCRSLPCPGLSSCPECVKGMDTALEFFEPYPQIHSLT